jgi:hypothetical protein
MTDTPDMKSTVRPRLGPTLRRWLRPRHWLPLAGVVCCWALLEFAMARMDEPPHTVEPPLVRHPAIGVVFSDLASLRAHQQAAGFELLGLLDVHFPVRVLTVKQAMEEVSLARSDGSQRLYRAGRGQRLEAMSVSGAAAGRGWIVWRQVSRNGTDERVSQR